MRESSIEKMIWTGVGVFVFAMLYEGLEMELASRYSARIAQDVSVIYGYDHTQAHVSQSKITLNHGRARSITIKGLGNCSLEVYADSPRAHHLPLRLEPDSAEGAKIVSTVWYAREAGPAVMALGQSPPLHLVKIGDGDRVPTGYVEAEMGSGQLETMVENACHTPGEVISTR